MPVKVRCPECGSVAAIPDNLVGRKLKCSNCEGQFVASSPSGVRAAGSRCPPRGRDWERFTQTHRCRVAKPLAASVLSR